MKAIITFHSIDTSGSVLSFPPVAFDRLLDALEESSLPVLPLDELLLKETGRGVAITFDDGIRSVYSKALPVLINHAAPAHLFLATGQVGVQSRWPRQSANTPGFQMLNWDEIEQLHDAGICIDSHTHTHPDMRKLNADEMREECELADELIEKRLGRRPRYFAYPYGYLNKGVSDFARSRYQGAVTTRLRMLGRDEDPAKLPRLDSYYLKHHWLQRNLGTLSAGLYLSIRGALRAIRGTQ
jgi:peptidoglycan/xylan/chitin deacetylase (PgdA/CDA1 family)